ncbi:ThuA domain-containing protein [soil metagenome]
MAKQIRVLVWDENPAHAPKELYPTGIRGAVAEGLAEFDSESELVISTAHLDDPEQGVSDEALSNTDVLIWWGHARHGEVNDAVADKVAKACRERGVGFVCLHSGHYSKTFKKVIGGEGHLKGGWRESTDTEEIYVCAPWHPVAKGVTNFTLANEEMYGSPFDVPPYETLVLQSYFPLGGESFPCGIAWTVGEGIDPEFTSGPGGGKGQGEGIGRVFYFRPGHETYGTYFVPDVRRVIYNAVRWTGKLV